MTVRRAVNDSLRALLTTADWTYEALARTVNALGAENGLRLRYDRTSVAHWLGGAIPRPRTRELLAEAFSRRLRRPVALAELGMGDSAPDGLGAAGPGRGGCAVARLAELCGTDADPARRSLVRQSLYSVAGLDAPGWPEGRDGHRSTRRPAAEGRPEGVESLRAAVDFFRHAGDFGGRHARTALVAYLHDDVVPRLHAEHRDGTRLRLPAEAAGLVRVLARMYVDSLENGAAQHYQHTALLLAAEAGDRTEYALALRDMSIHALDLGHRRAALRLAEDAVRTASADAPAGIRASLLSQLALGQAAHGDGRQATATLAAAERIRDRPLGPGRADRDTLSPSQRACLDFRKGRALAALGDHAAAVAALRSSLEHRPATAYLPRALAHAEIARLLLADGRLEESCAAWQRFLDDYPHLRSGRADQALTELRGRLRPYAARPSARALLGRAAAAARRAG